MPVVEPDVQRVRHGRRDFNYHILVPLVYMPLFPCMRLLMKGRFPQRTIDLSSSAIVGAALVHAAYIMYKGVTVSPKHVR